MEYIPAEHNSTEVWTRGKTTNLERWSFCHDYPGQWERFEDEFFERKDNIKRFRSTRRKIVLMCCAYGFHSDWGEQAGFGVSKKEATTDNAAAALEKCRYNEKYFLTNFLQRIAKESFTALDMITVILKHDLWFKYHKEAEDFYTKKEQTLNDGLPSYSEILSSFRTYNSMGDNFRHFIYPLSLRRQEFVANVRSGSETIYSQGEYTSSLEQGYRALFLQRLDGLIQSTAG